MSRVVARQSSPTALARSWANWLSWRAGGLWWTPTPQAAAAQTEAKDVGKKAVAFAEQNLARLQAEFLKTQMQGHCRLHYRCFSPVPQRWCRKRSQGENRTLSAASPIRTITNIIPIT